MGNLYILKDTGYQEYKDLLEAGVKIKDMNSYLEHHRDEELLGESKISKKNIFRYSLFLIIFLLFSAGTYFIVNEFRHFLIDDVQVATEGIVVK